MAEKDIARRIVDALCDQMVKERTRFCDLNEPCRSIMAILVREELAPLLRAVDAVLENARTGLGPELTAHDKRIAALRAARGGA